MLQQYLYISMWKLCITFYENFANGGEWNYVQLKFTLMKIKNKLLW